VYGCGTWFLTLRKEHRIRVLKKELDLRREKVTGGWRKLHNEALHKLYSPNIGMIK
jgi:hypothetical protein